MRTSHSTQGRLDCKSIPDIELNLECRDEIIPILAALKHVYTKPDVLNSVLELVEQDVNPDSSSDHGREGLQYWQIVVLAGVRLGCNLNYDRLQDLAENHRNLRHMMGIGDWDEETSFSWRRIRDNICLLRPETIEQISHIIVSAGHALDPEAAHVARADSFVVETNIHYPTESSLIWDGLRKVIDLSVAVADELEVPGWRQHSHLYKKIKNLNREISRVSASDSPKSKKRLKQLYRTLLKHTKRLLDRSDNLVKSSMSNEVITIGHIEELRVFIGRTRQVASTAYRRVVLGEQVPNEDKLFSIFEPHTQLYRRGKAGQENQFGRLALIYEDGAGFITHHYLLDRDENDADVTVSQTRLVQDRLDGAIERISFDRGFYSRDNERELKEIVSSPCLPKRGANEYAEQMDNGCVRFRAARQYHAGVESAIGALQSGNGLKRSRDRTEIGVTRYLSLAVFGRNLHVLGKLLIAQHSPDTLSAYRTRKKSA